MVKVQDSHITMTRGDTLRLELSLTKNGQPYTLQEGDTIRFACKKNYSDTETLIEKEIEDDLVLELQPLETKGLAYEDYVYDIQMTYADGSVDTFIAEATLTIAKEVE